MVVDSNYYINRIDDFIDEEGILRALQYRYTNWGQPDNATAIRQELINLYSDELYVSCADEAARYHASKWPNKTYMYVFQHRSRKAETPIWMGSPHGNDLYYLFGVPFFNDSILIPWYGYRINDRYFLKEDQEVSNYTMHLIVNFARYGNPTPYGYFSDRYYYNNYNPYTQYDPQTQVYENHGFAMYATTADSFTKNLNISWQPMQPNNLTYLVINPFPQLRVEYRYDQAGFWNYYWSKLWDKRLSITPTPALKNAILTYQDSYILVWVFIAVSLLLAFMLIISCFIICRRIKKDKYDEDEF